MKLENPKNGEIISSAFETDASAAHAVGEKLVAGDFLKKDFPESLIRSYHTNGGLSPAQRFWLHKLAKPSKAESVGSAESLNLHGIVSLFEKASTKLKRPSVKIKVGAKEVKIYIAGDRSKYKGDLMVVSPNYGEAYYGRISKDGKFFSGSTKCGDVRNALIEFNKDPEGFASMHGKSTGNCCFCTKHLTDHRSVDVGYGPVCAGNYGLKWG